MVPIGYGQWTDYTPAAHFGEWHCGNVGEAADAAGGSQSDCVGRRRGRPRRVGHGGLNLAYNDIGDIAPLLGLRRLARLDLSGNRLQQPCPERAAMPSMTELIFEPVR